MKKLRFLFTASRASHIENFHASAIAALRSAGHIVDTAAEGSVRKGLADRSYELTFKKKIYSPKNLVTIKRLTDIIKDGSYDVVISNTTLAGTVTKLALSRVKKRPYHIYICHGYLFNDDNSEKARLYRSVERLTASSVDLLLVMNRDDLETAGKYRLCKDIRSIYGMGVDTDRFPALEEQKLDAFRKALGIRESDFVFLCVAEFSERKNQRLIIEAFSELLKRKPDSVLIFAGDGELLEDTKRLAEYYELSDRVRFLGYRADTNILYRSAQAVVSASHIEGLPFNIMEALECNIPAVVSDIKGHRDLIKDGVNGLLFENNISRELAEKMYEISNAEAYKRLRQNAFLEDKYKAEKATEVLLNYYLGSPASVPTYSA